jgi:hypothetical protein
LLTALLASFGFDTQSLSAQGGQRRPHIFNKDRDNPANQIGVVLETTFHALEPGLRRSVGRRHIGGACRAPGSRHRPWSARIHLFPEGQDFRGQEIGKPATGIENLDSASRIEVIIGIESPMPELSHFVRQSDHMFAKNGRTFLPRQSQPLPDALKKVSMRGRPSGNILTKKMKNSLEHSFERHVARLHGMHKRHLGFVRALGFRFQNQQILVALEHERSHPKMVNTASKGVLDINPPGIHQARTLDDGTTLARNPGEA